LSRVIGRLLERGIEAALDPLIMRKQRGSGQPTGQEDTMAQCSIKHIGDYKPHVTIQTPDRNVHVLPVALFEDFIDGKISLSEIDDGEQLMRSVVGDWLRSMGPY
jgi:hypothetical protein